MGGGGVTTIFTFYVKNHPYPALFLSDPNPEALQEIQRWRTIIHYIEICIRIEIEEREEHLYITKMFVHNSFHCVHVKYQLRDVNLHIEETFISSIRI